mmetsp:Transcript_12344/g.22342  ORF Transcript_12344/g.22342 Transcript_12344/m.22342 type:complete len:113 (-) Transcript_12344:639-977(-)
MTRYSVAHTRYICIFSSQFCPRFAHPKTASTIIDSAIEDAKEAAANLVFDSIQTTGTASSNSIVHTPIPSFTNDNKRPKRKTPSKSLSSSTSLGSEMNGEETQKKEETFIIQ